MFRSQKKVDIKVVSTLSISVSHCVYFTNFCNKISSFFVVSFIKISLLDSFSLYLHKLILDALHFLFNLYCFYYKPSSISFNDHELIDICFLIQSPLNIEILNHLLKVLFKSVEDVYIAERLIGSMVVEFLDSILDSYKEFKEMLSTLNDFFRKDVFLSVNP